MSRLHAASASLLSLVLLVPAVPSAALASARGTLLQRIGRRLVPARVTRGAQGAVTLVRHGYHAGTFQEIERIESSPTGVRRIAKQIIVRGGDEQDATVESVTGPDGVTHTTTMIAGAPTIRQSLTTGFHPLTFRSALWRAVQDNPGTFVLKLAGVAGVGLGLLTYVGVNLGNWPFAPEPGFAASVTKLGLLGGAAIGGLAGLATFPTEAPKSPRIGDAEWSQASAQP